MAVLATETWTGANGSAWPAQWTAATNSSGAATIQANAGQLGFGTSSGYSFGASAYLSGMAAVADSDTAVTVSFAQIQEEYLFLAARSDGTRNVGYAVSISASTGLSVGPLGAGNTFTNLSGSLGGAWTAGVARKIRFRVAGSSLSVKVWDAVAAEPASWTWTGTDTTWTAAGRFMAFVNTGASTSGGTVSLDDLTIWSPYLTDDFATKDTTTWSWGANAASTAGQLALTATAAYDGTVTSLPSFDLTGGAGTVQLAQMVTGSGTGSPEAYFDLFDAGTNTTSKNSLYFGVLGGTLTASWRNAAGTGVTLATTAYSATTHKWWRIRQTAATFVWETSANGSAWTQFASLASSSVPFTALRAQLGAGLSGTYTPTAPAAFDNFSLAAVPPVWVNRTLIQAPRNGTTSHTVGFTAATAGNLLVAVVSGGVTSTTPTGWTLPSGGSAVGGSGAYVFTKTAAAGESSFTTTHNGSNYPIGVVVYEFAAGTTFGSVTGAGARGNGDASLTLSGLTGTNHLFAVESGGCGIGSTGTPTYSWSGPAVAVDTDAFTPYSATDGYELGVAYAASSTATSFTPVVTQSGLTGGSGSFERIAFAVSAVAPTPAAFVQQVGTATATASASTLVFTVPAGVSTTAGNTLILAAEAPGSVTFTAADSKGNSYATARRDASGSTLSNGILASTTTTGLVAGDTITLTTSAAQWATLAIYEFAGITAAADLTVGSNVTTASTSYDTTSGTVLTGPHVLFSLVGMNTGGRVATPTDTGWIALGNAAVTASFPRSTGAFYQLVSTGGGTLDNAGTLNSSVLWAAGAIAFPSTVPAVTTRSVSLAGSGGLSTGVGLPAPTQTAAASGSGGLSVLGRPTPVAAATLAGAGTLAPTSAAIGGPPALFTGTGTLAPGVGTPRPVSSGALSALGALTTAGSAGPRGTAALSGTGGLAVGTRTPKPGQAGALAGGGGLVPGAAVLGWILSAGGTLTTTGWPSVSATSPALTGSGALGTVGRATFAASFAPSASGTLSVLASPGPIAGAPYTLPALSGAGTLAFTSGVYGFRQTPALSGTGALRLPVATPRTSGGDTVVFADTFDTLDPAVWFIGSLASVSGGRLVCPDDPTWENSWLASRNGSLVGAMASIEVVQAAGLGGRPIFTDVDSWLNFRVDAGNEIAIDIEYGALEATVQLGGTYSTLASIPYDPVAHRWVRLQESNGIISWEHSADGRAWVSYMALAAPFSLAAGSVGIGVGGGDGTEVPAIFDNFSLVRGALTGAGTLAVAPRAGVAVAPALSGSGALAPVGVGNPLGRGLLSGAGALVAAGSPGIIAIAPGYAVQFTGTGALRSTATLTLSGAAAFGGVGHLSLVGVYPSGSGAPLMGATVTLLGSGALSFAATVLERGLGPLGGSGALVASGTPGIGAGLGVAPFGSSPFGGGAPLLAALAGAGALTSGATTAVVAGALLVGAGSLSVARTPSLTAAAALTGSGALAGLGGPRLVGAALLTGGSSLVVTSAPPRILIGPGLVGVGILAVAVIPRPAVGLYFALTGLGTLSSASGSYGFTPTVALAGAGALSTLAQPALLRTVSLTGLGALATVVLAGPRASATLSGSGALTLQQRPGLLRVAPFTGLGTLVGSQTGIGVGVGIGSAPFGTGSFGGSSGLTAGAGGVGTLAVADLVTLAGRATLAATGQLLSLARVTASGAAAISMVGTLSIPRQHGEIVGADHPVWVTAGTAPPAPWVRLASPTLLATLVHDPLRVRRTRAH